MQTRMSSALEPLRENAMKLFDSREALDLVIEAGVEFAVTVFPKAKDGKPWLAEPAGELSNLTGHLDFESQDGTEIIDLKTTARKPDNARMKPLHLAQLVSYWDLRGRKAKTAKILYLDSMKGAWGIMTGAVDFTNPFVIEHGDEMAKYRDHIMADPSAMAVVGDHCKSGFCSYRNSRVCYASLVPSGEESQLHENSLKTKSVLAGPKVKKVQLW